MIRVGDIALFDPSQYLDTAEARAEYLTAVMEDGTDEEIRRALGVVARAMGGQGDLAHGGEPAMILGDGASAFATVVRMMKAWGIGLSATPLTPAE